MAEASISVDHDQFSCPVCLDLLKDPVTVPCGHSFCMVCINGCWDQEDQRGIYSCPQCRETFTPRPVLRRNNMLAEVVEKLKKNTELQAASPAPRYAGAGDVECDFCTGRKLKAIKSCLMCLASFCEAHLEPHYEVPGLKKHKLVKASTQLQENNCSQHDRLIEIYCHTDQSCICSLCPMDKHRGHDTVPATTERSEKQNQLKEMQKKLKQRIQEKQKKLQELKQTVNTLKRSAQAAVEDSERIFTELIRSIEKKRSEVTDLIRDQEKAELSGAEELLEKLQQEMADLKRRHTELEQLSHTEDHIHFLQSFQSLCVSSGSLLDSPSITVHQHPSFDGVRKSLSELKERLEEFCREEFRKILPHVAAGQILPSEPKNREDFLQYFCRLTLDPNTANCFLILSEKIRESFQSLCVSSGSEDSPSITVHQHPSFDGVRKSLSELKERLEEFCREEFRKIPPHVAAGQILPSKPKTRGDFMLYFCQLTLDPNTAHPHLILAEKNRVVKWSDKPQTYFVYPETIDGWLQVLCKESVCGRCYWEVEWSGGCVYISVSYKGISRKGRGADCGFGFNSQSWSLVCSSSLSFLHNNIQTDLSAPPSSRIGVYVDHSAGTLSFYSVSDTMTLLHTLHTSFTQPLHAGFYVGGGSSVRLCDKS